MSPVETILDKGNFTLEELLDKEEIIEECKALNSRLINFLRERPQIEQLVRYIVEEAPEDAEKKRIFKFPSVSCEIFACGVDIILVALAMDEELLDLLFSFLEPNRPHSTLIAGYFSKVVICLLLWKTVPVIYYIKAHQEIIWEMIDLIGMKSILEVLVCLIGADENIYSYYAEVIVNKMLSSDVYFDDNFAEIGLEEYPYRLFLRSSYKGFEEYPTPEDFLKMVMSRLEHEESRPKSEFVLKVGALYCDDHVGTNLQVLIGIWEYLKVHAKGSTLYMFYNGPSGLMRSEYAELDTADVWEPYQVMMVGKRGRFGTPEQFQNAENTVRDLQLDGLVFIGGDDATINAHLLADHFSEKDVNTCVICCPSTIHGDTCLNHNQVPCCLGFDNVCKTYSEMIGDIKEDAQSRGECYHFVGLNGYAASRITLECALKKQPNIALIGDELSAKKLTLKEVGDQIGDVICKRSELGYNYGVILISQGLIYSIVEIRKLFRELHEMYRNERKELTIQSRELCKILPDKTMEVLLLRSDPQGNTMLPEIDSELMLFEVVKIELEKRKKKGLYKGDFKGLSYNIKCMQLDIVYKWCYEFGFAAGEYIRCGGKTGHQCLVENLAEPDFKWIVAWTPLASLVRNGKQKLVIKKPKVELDGVTFKRFECARPIWAIQK